LFNQAELQWIHDHLPIIVGVAVAVVIIVVMLGLVMMWLGSRGRFMFMDGVIRNRGAVAAPWKEYKSQGNSLFLFRLCFGIAACATAVLILAFAAIIALPDIKSGHFRSAAWEAIAISGTMFVLFGLATAAISTFLSDFVAPIMYIHRVGVMAAWSAFSSSMLPGNGWKLVLYLLMKFVLGFVVRILALVAFCATCCIAIIPYVGSVIMLPFSVFMQSYSLYFFEQFGPSWRVFPPDAPPSAFDPSMPGAQ
jgi:hypothetical protein